MPSPDFSPITNIVHLVFRKCTSIVYLQTLLPWSWTLIPNCLSELLKLQQRWDYIWACWINKASTFHRSHMLLFTCTQKPSTALLLVFLTDICACLRPYLHPQTLMLAWQLWITAWMLPRLAMWTTCARNCAQSMSQLVSNPLPSRACATGLNAIRRCAGSSTGFPPITHTSCSSAPVRTRHAQSVGGRPLCPAALMKAWKNPTASHRWGSAKLITSAG